MAPSPFAITAAVLFSVYVSIPPSIPMRVRALSLSHTLTRARTHTHTGSQLMIPEEGIDMARSAALELARDHYLESLTRKVCICSNPANCKLN